MKEKLPLATKSTLKKTSPNEIETKNTKKRVRTSDQAQSSKKIKGSLPVKSVDKARLDELKIKYLPIMRLYFNGSIEFEVFKTTLLKFKIMDNG